MDGRGEHKGCKITWISHSLFLPPSSLLFFLYCDLITWWTLKESVYISKERGSHYIPSKSKSHIPIPIGFALALPKTLPQSKGCPNLGPSRFILICLKFQSFLSFLFPLNDCQLCLLHFAKFYRMTHNPSWLFICS